MKRGFESHLANQNAIKKTAYRVQARAIRLKKALEEGLK